MCEHQGRYQRCANWTLDLKNNVLNEHHVDEFISASATITGESLKVLFLAGSLIDADSMALLWPIKIENQFEIPSK